MSHTSFNQNQKPVAALLLLPASLLVLGFLITPSIILFRYSFNAFDPIMLMRETVTLSNYIEFFSQPYYQQVILNTLFVAIVCTIGSVALGFPVAYALARTQSRFKSVYIILIVFPLLVGNVVRAAGWIALLDSHGFINIVLLKIGLIDSPIHMMYSTFAVIIGTLSVVLPIMILSLQSVLESIDYSLLDASMNLGASRLTAFRRIILPLALPGVVAGSVFVFILCMNAYATPYLLGGPSFKMMALSLYREIAVKANWPMGSALAFILMFVTVVATGLFVRLLTKKRY